MTPVHRVMTNTGILYARMAITLFISLYATRITLAALGVHDFGIFNLVAGVITMLLFLNTAMAGATQRFISHAEGAGDSQKVLTIFNVSVVLHLGIAVIVFGVLELAGYFLFKGVLKIPPDRMVAAQSIFQFMIVSTVFTIVSVPYDAVINAHENMLFVALLGILESLLKLAVAIYITSTTFDKLVTFGVLTALSTILLLYVRWVYCSKRYTECKVALKYYDKSVFKEMRSFAGWSLLGSTSSMIGQYGQGIVLNVFFGPVVNAAQGIANQVSGQLGALATTMQKALNPLIMKSEGARNRDLLLKSTLLGSKISFFLWMIFTIPALIEMEYLLRLWLGKVPDYATIFCQLYLARILIDQLSVTIGTSISAVGNIKAYQAVYAILSFAPLAISYALFLWGYPPYVLYVVFIVNSILVLMANIYFAHRVWQMPISVYMRNVFTRAVAVFCLTFLVSVFASMLSPAQPGQTIIVLAVSSFCSVLFGYKIGLTSGEASLAKSLLSALAGKLKIV